MSELRKKLAVLCDGKLTYRELSERIDRSISYTQELVREMKLPQPKRDTSKSRKPSKENSVKIEQLKILADGELTSQELSELTGLSHKYTQKLILKLDLPRLPQSPRSGENNQSWIGGRRIDLDGYVLVRSPKDSPSQRKNGSIYEHRLVMEGKIGRYLKPLEVVDHIDSITIHNDPQNLRLFANNPDHLRATISDQVPNWSEAGREKQLKEAHLRKSLPVIDTYRLRKERGDVRLQTILRAWLLLDKDSPYLLCTTHWLAKAGISDFSRSSLELHLLLLRQKYT